jgi:hypothetical protein
VMMRIRRSRLLLEFLCRFLMGVLRLLGDRTDSTEGRAVFRLPDLDIDFGCELALLRSFA